MISNISLSYKPQVHAFQPLTTNAGIEYLTVAFPLTKYPGHLMVSATVFVPVASAALAQLAQLVAQPLA